MKPQKRLYIFLAAVLFATSLHAAASAANRFEAVETLVEQSIADNVFPAASIAVIYRDNVVFHKAFGHMTYGKNSPPVDTSTIFDVASLTKPIVTTSIVMQLSERDSLNLDAPVSSYIPEFSQSGKENVTVKNLLLHNSGLIAHRFLIKTSRTADEAIASIYNEPLRTQTGTKTTYSDLGFITLGKVIERVTGNSLEENFSVRFSKPLGMQSTLFNPPKALHPRIAPTEKDTLWSLTKPRPLVHDHNAALLGGIAGHAGLFSTTEDLLVFVHMLLQEGRYDNRVFFLPSTLKRFTRRNLGSRALGWDLRSLNGSSSSGQYFSARTYGHLGYTGTSIWIDPEKELAVITLTNRVHPTSENTKIRRFRPLLHDAVVKCLDLDE
ncbi:serine hydrolase domain-containing protein [Prosthecochloris sp.]|uniref:serine hydrolase domain-containing protein n=1 Tax=Prosthecochloris sp. TaxID=290513 RepID=UPI0025F8B702|nr:serine hydrolase domain-containing protein [Prosthecochloris sp.]